MQAVEAIILVCRDGSLEDIAQRSNVAQSVNGQCYQVNVTRLFGPSQSYFEMIGLSVFSPLKYGEPKLSNRASR